MSLDGYLKKNEEYMINNYDLDLLIKLNEEWKDHPFQPSAPVYSYDEQIRTAERRYEALKKKVILSGKRILEIGGGAGYTAYVIARENPDSEVVCIDIYRNDQWSYWEDLNMGNFELKVADLTYENPFNPEEFDLIVSYVAWEHMRHPYEVMKKAASVLKTEGIFFLYANLYRGPNASHLYRTIFFPWPHLLFDDSIVKQYALDHGEEEGFIEKFYNVNKLTFAEYKEYFRILNLKILEQNRSIYKIDKGFYERFYDKLSLYPIFDLETKFFSVLLQKNL